MCFVDGATGLLGTSVVFRKRTYALSHFLPSQLFMHADLIVSILQSSAIRAIGATAEVSVQALQFDRFISPVADNTVEPRLDILCTISTAGAVPTFIAVVTVGAVPAAATTFAIGAILAGGATIAACAVSTSCAVCVLVRSHFLVKLRPTMREMIRFELQ